jgi:tetratricopeptide (TPR) repeat protein
MALGITNGGAVWRRMGGIAACIAFVWAAAPARTARAETVRELNDRAVRLVESGDFGGAVDALRRAYNQARDNEVVKRNLVQALNGWGVKLSDVADYENAVRRLEEAWRLDPEMTVVRSNLATVRLNYGLREMEQSKFSYAERHLTDAYQTAAPDQLATIDQRRATLYLLWARDARRQGRTADAVRRLEKSLQVAPTYVPALLEMGDVAYRRGSNQEALEYYLEARTHDPNVAGLEDLIAKIGREQQVEGDFEVQSNRYFTVSYEGEIPVNAAREVLSMLWRAHRLIGRELQVYPRERLPVVLYRRDQYQFATVAPDWSGALFDGKIRVPVTGDMLKRREEEQLQVKLFHEYTHAMIRELVPETPLPGWLNEGLACTLELDRAERRDRDDEDRRLLKQVLRRGERIGLAEMPVEFTTIRGQKEAEMAYRIARSFVGWLIDRYRMDGLRSALEQIGKGAAIDAAFENVYRKNLERLEREWIDDLTR